MTTLVSVVVTIEIDGTLEDIGRKDLKDHIKDSILSVGDKRLEDPLRLIEDVRVSKVRTVLSPRDVKVAGGLARANSLSPERRSEIARTAAAARWSK